MSVLRVHNLTKIYESGIWPFQHRTTYTAVQDVSFKIDKGEILGLLGPNGAGKTTTIQMLLGTLTPTQGSITYFDVDFASHQIQCLKRIGYASGYDKLPGQLTVEENLDLAGRIYGLSTSIRREHIDKLLAQFGIEHTRTRQTGHLSAGQSTRVLLVKAFLADPDIVLLDEPTASLDPDIAHEVRQFILDQRDERGASILITSHNMAEVTELCDRVLVLKKGTIIANNTPLELAQSTSKVKIRLGITSSLEQALAYIQSLAVSYTIQHSELVVELEEHAIAKFLSELSAHRVEYAQISIDKPTLEDYFLSIAKER